MIASNIASFWFCLMLYGSVWNFFVIVRFKSLDYIQKFFCKVQKRSCQIVPEAYMMSDML
jgi:hypothetical protein